MSISKTREVCRILPLVGLLCLVASVIVPGPAGATKMLYTYLGNPFDHSDPPGVTIGDSITITFTHDGLVQAGDLITEFTITCGSIQLTEQTYQAWQGVIYAVEAGLPTLWEFYVRSGSSANSAGYILWSEALDTGFSRDRAIHMVNLSQYDASQWNTYTPGVWYKKAVAGSVPPAVLLLGSD